MTDECGLDDEQTTMPKKQQLLAKIKNIMVSKDVDDRNWRQDRHQFGSLESQVPSYPTHVSYKAQPQKFSRTTQQKMPLMKSNTEERKLSLLNYQDSRWPLKS